MALKESKFILCAPLNLGFLFILQWSSELFLLDHSKVGLESPLPQCFFQILLRSAIWLWVRRKVSLCLHLINVGILGYWFIIRFSGLSIFPSHCFSLQVKQIWNLSLKTTKVLHIPRLLFCIQPPHHSVTGRMTFIDSIPWIPCSVTGLDQWEASGQDPQGEKVIRDSIPQLPHR